MAQEKFKYNINHQLSFLPRSVSIGDFEKILEKKHGISRATFYADRRILLTDEQSIPEDRLQVYAGLFDVSMDDLINKKIKVKSIFSLTNTHRFKSPLSNP